MQPPTGLRFDDSIRIIDDKAEQHNTQGRRQVHSCLNCISCLRRATTSTLITDELHSLLRIVQLNMATFICAIVLFSCFLTGSSFKQDLVLDGVSLPVNFSSSTEFFPALTAQSRLVTGTFLAQNYPYFASIVGKNKTDPQVTAIFEKYLKNYVNFTIRPDLPSDYMHFGNNINYQNVPYIFRTNSFFMASLRSGPNMTFEVDPFGKRGVTYFSQLTACLKSSVPRVRAVFDSKMEIVSLQVFDSSGRSLRGFSDEKAATLLLYQCSYYAQNIHTSTHVSTERKFLIGSILA